VRQSQNRRAGQNALVVRGEKNISKGEKVSRLTRLPSLWQSRPWKGGKAGKTLKKKNGPAGGRFPTEKKKKPQKNIKARICKQKRRIVERQRTW